jgi:hypothetical protein
MKLYAKQQKVQNTLEGKLTAMECESAVEQYQEMLFYWESRQEDKKTMDYTVNDQSNG